MPFHLFVLIHGVLGARSDLKHIGAAISEKVPDSLCFAITTNERTTTDGIENCASRAKQEVVGVLEKQPQLKTLSVIGHSLGGIIGRYMLGLLEQEGVEFVFVAYLFL